MLSASKSSPCARILLARRSRWRTSTAKSQFAHPSNIEGVRVALASGVEVLAHAPDTTEGIDDALIAEMAGKATMIPTLKMFATTVSKNPAYLVPIYRVVRRFHAHGGNLMFGTDVGYMADYSTRDELRRPGDVRIEFHGDFAHAHGCAGGPVWRGGPERNPARPAGWPTLLCLARIRRKRRRPSLTCG